jgi:hypothetical protein
MKRGVPHNTDSPADLLMLIRGLDRDQLDMARHAIDVTVCDTIGSSNLTIVSKALSSPSAGPAFGEAQKRARFSAKITEAQLMVPDWVPCFAFYPMGSISKVRGAGPRCLFLTLQLLLAPIPRLYLKLASCAALSK